MARPTGLIFALCLLAGAGCGKNAPVPVAGINMAGGHP